MQVVKYLHNSHANLLENLDQKIGDGADGEVFTLKNSENVLKFSIHYFWKKENLQEVNASKLKSFNLVKEYPNLFVKIFNFSHLINGSRKIVDGEQDYSIFCYEMEKLEKISDDEKKVFHSTISHEDANLKKNLSPGKIKSILEGLSFGLDFDAAKITYFIDNLKKLQSAGIEYTDLHPRNIMKTKNGQFKLIDIDRIYF